MKSWWNDLKISRSAGFQHGDLTKKSLENRTGGWNWNWKGIDETSLYPYKYEDIDSSYVLPIHHEGLQLRLGTHQ